MKNLSAVVVLDSSYDLRSISKLLSRLGKVSTPAPSKKTVASHLSNTKLINENNPIIDEVGKQPVSCAIVNFRFTNLNVDDFFKLLDFDALVLVLFIEKINTQKYSKNLVKSHLYYESDDIKNEDKLINACEKFMDSIGYFSSSINKKENRNEKSYAIIGKLTKFDQSIIDKEDRFNDSLKYKVSELVDISINMQSYSRYQNRFPDQKYSNIRA